MKFVLKSWVSVLCFWYVCIPTTQHHKISGIYPYISIITTSLFLFTLAMIGVMIFFGYFLIYLVRYNVSVHIVGMAQITNREDQTAYFQKNIQILTGPPKSARTGAVDIISWDDIKIGKLFSAYHIGFCVCFPIFHSFGDRVGPTWVVAISGLLSGILTCLAPAAGFFNFWALFILRIIVGFSAGAMQPSMVQLLRHWVPPTERNYFMWAYCGITIGTCCTFLLCALVHYHSRWPVGFYISGGFQIAWSMLWIVLVTDSPRLHPCISKHEVEYLTNTIGNVFTIKLTNARAPWKIILRSIPFWALCILNFGYAWIIIALSTHGPLFYSRIAGYNIYNASALTALPFFLRLVLGTVVIQTFHWYQHSSSLKRIKHIRKYMIVVSHVVPGILVALSWIVNVVPGPILLTVAVSLTAAGMELTLNLCYELAPNYVNSIHTVIKIIGNASGIIVSLGVGYVTDQFKNSRTIWKHIWCFHATILFLSGLVFLIWGETEVQPWNFRSYRSRRKLFIPPKTSIMSDITEVEEDSAIMRMSQMVTSQQ